mgnify:CR=1 FL=1
MLSTLDVWDEQLARFGAEVLAAGMVPWRSAKSGIEAFTARAVRTMSAAGSFHRYRRG